MIENSQNCRFLLFFSLFSRFQGIFGGGGGGGRGRRVFPAGGALAIYSSKKWVYWRCDPIYADLTWYVFLKNKVQQGCPRLLWRHVRIRWD